MTTLEHEIKIDAPLEKVWGILMDLELVADYNPMVRSAKYITENKTGTGAARICNFKPKGFAKERVVEVNGMTSVTMEIYETDWPLKTMRWTHFLVSEDSSTIMKTKTEFNAKFGIIGTIMERLMMKPKFDTTLSKIFSGLKNYAEKK